jgi:transcriptional regulator with XRE-family HTH domain
MTTAPPADTVATVRAELARRNISHRAAANTLGWTASTFSRRMKGRVDFTVTEIRALADLLEVPVAQLLGEDRARA